MPVKHLKNLTDAERINPAQFLRDAINADGFPLSPRVRRLKELLTKLDPTPPRVVEPVTAPKPSAQSSMVLAKKRRR
jgi:hypothetical protein